MILMKFLCFKFLVVHGITPGKNTSLYDKSTELSCLDSPSQNTPNPMEHECNSKSSNGMMLFGCKYYL